MMPNPSIDRMPALLAFYAGRLDPQDKTPLLMRKAWLGIVDEPLVKADTVVIQTRSDGVVQGYHHKAHEADFIKAPDGSLDFGEITPAMSKAMRRQAGKIRLRQGNESWGLVHIEARHGKDFKALGFDSAKQFIALVASNFTKIYKGTGAALDVVIDDQHRGMLIVQLEPSADGDFYDIKTATPIRRDQFKNKSPLWERVGPNTSVTQGNPSYPGSQSGRASVGATVNIGNTPLEKSFPRIIFFNRVKQ